MGITPVELDIYFHTDSTSTAKAIDIDYHITQCDTRPMTFYNIDAIGIGIEDDGFEYGVIHVGGDSFSSVMTYEQLKQRLR